jgi:hypothetical protein
MPDTLTTIAQPETLDGQPVEAATVKGEHHDREWPGRALRTMW